MRWASRNLHKPNSRYRLLFLHLLFRRNYFLHTPSIVPGFNLLLRNTGMPAKNFHYPNSFLLLTAYRRNDTNRKKGPSDQRLNLNNGGNYIPEERRFVYVLESATWYVALSQEEKEALIALRTLPPPLGQSGFKNGNSYNKNRY
jgi:hypothetical protein